MGKSFYLAFRTSSTIVEAFHIVNGAAKHKHILEFNTETNTWICNCLAFRMAPEKCLHMKFVTDKVTHMSFNSDIWHELTPKSLDEGEIGLYDFSKGKASIVSTSLPNIGVMDLLLVMEDMKSVDISTKGGNLNRSRLLVQCRKSLDSDISFLDKLVRDIGVEDESTEVKEVSTPEPIDPSEGYDRKAWRRIEKPDKNMFYVDDDLWNAIICSIHNGQNILLTGPSGCGKSEIVYLAAKQSGLDIEAFNMGAMSEPRLSLIGTTHFSKDKGTWFGESRFVRAVRKETGVVLLDELTRCVPAAYNILLPLLDRQGYIALDESEDAAVIHKGKRVAFCATANIGMEYTGTEEMDKAMNDRFQVVLDMTFPPPAQEINVIKTRTKLDVDTVSKLVNIAVKQREMCVEGDFVGFISTRMLLSAAQSCKDGMSLLNAIKFSIENHFSSAGGDASERAKIRQIFQKTGGRS